MAIRKLGKPKLIRQNNMFQLIEIDGVQYLDVGTPKHDALREQIRDGLENAIEYDQVEFMNDRYPLDLLVEYRHCLGPWARPNVPPFGRLLDAHQKKRSALVEERLAKGVVEMNDLPRLFRPNDEVICMNGEGEEIGGKLRSIEIERGFFTTYIKISMEVIHAMFGQPQTSIWETEFRGFRGLREIALVPIRKVTEEDKQRLGKRGEKYISMCKPGSYVHYQGTIDQPGYWVSRSYRADGRVVVDPISFTRLEPELWNNMVHMSGISRHDNSERGVIRKMEVGEEDYWRCMPYLYGFSMTAKQWGRLKAPNLSPIQFREDAFTTLVLEPETKDMVHALVKYHGGSFTDIIDGKGGGCIFLLHGKPGLGKTATAEAVAEVLHKPLYAVGVGELGTNTKSLEESLRKILDVATIWDAVVLLDEADIFLEARDAFNVERNAMVGVFLRLLEYHSGILFLTTNRVKDIDRAFYSRISVAVHYHHTNNDKRKQIWHNLLKAAGMDTSFAEDLKSYDVNGRQIKNAIRLSQTLARARDSKVELSDLRSSIEASLRFEDEMHMVVPDEEEGEELEAVAGR